MPRSEERTATVASGITASLQSLTVLFAGVSALASRSKDYDDVSIVNTGSDPIYFAVIRDNTEVPTNADRKTLQPGQEKTFSELNTDLVFIATSNIGGTNAFEFEGKPVYRA